MKNVPSIAFAVSLILVTIPYLANDTKYMKYPKKFGLRTYETGPKPGSVAPPNQSEAEFKRVYCYPANLRILVRATCSRNITKKDLIDRAEQLSEAQSPVQELDWDTIKADDRYSYWAVVYSKSEVVTFSLKSQDDKWVIKSKNKTEQEHWDVKKLVLPRTGKSCIDPESFSKKEIQKTIHDYLIEKSLANFRGNW